MALDQWPPRLDPPIKSLAALYRLEAAAAHAAYRARQMNEGGNPAVTFDSVLRIEATFRWATYWRAKAEHLLQPPTMEPGMACSSEHHIHSQGRGAVCDSATSSTAETQPLLPVQECVLPS